MAGEARWPLLMDLATACRYVSHTRVDFLAMVGAGLMPPARENVPGQPRWHRGELDRAADRLWELESKVSHERAKEEARLALAAVRPPAPRRGNQQRHG